uniref:Uncharacterized protein n=1 Tax=Peromyscus maniculatus bairdii TaxID=230844 RepID=A0A8C8UJP8_PERMB
MVYFIHCYDMEETLKWKEENPVAGGKLCWCSCKNHFNRRHRYSRCDYWHYCVTGLSYIASSLIMTETFFINYESLALA